MTQRSLLALPAFQLGETKNEHNHPVSGLLSKTVLEVHNNAHSGPNP